jgi:hypothetical protein
MMRIAQTTLLAGLIAFTLGCGYSSKMATPQPGSMPAIVQLVPASANAGAPAFTLTVNGSNFSTNAAIAWNGTGRTTTFVTANQLTAIISTADVAAAGTVQVSVTNPGSPGTGTYGTGATQAETSNVVTFTIN